MPSFNTSINLIVGLPCFLFPDHSILSILLPIYPSSFLRRCPYHLSLLASRVFSPNLPTCAVPLMYSFMIFTSQSTYSNQISPRLMSRRHPHPLDVPLPAHLGSPPLSPAARPHDVDLPWHITRSRPTVSGSLELCPSHNSRRSHVVLDIRVEKEAWWWNEEVQKAVKEKRLKFKQSQQSR